MSEEIESLKARVAEAEDIIRAKNKLIQAMYDSTYELSWPREASELEGAYEERYGVYTEYRQDG